MLAKCLNPACSSSFRYLHEGRIFRIETPDPAVVATSLSVQRTEHFWLCAVCCMRLKVVVEDGKVTTHPIAIEPNVVPFPKRARAAGELSISAAKRARLR